MPEDFSDLIPDSKKPKLPVAPVAPIAPAAPAAAAPAAPGGLTDFGDLAPKAPGAAAPAAPAAPAPAPAAPAPAPPTANDLILQHLGGQRGIGSDQVAAPPRQGSWWDAVPGTKYYGEPAQPGPQSWLDWFSKNYNPSAADAATAYGDAWSYGLSPLAAQGVKAGAKGLQGATGHPYDPLPGVDPDAMRARINTAYENLGPAGPLVSAAGMATQPLTYLGVGPISRAVGGVAGAAAERYLPGAVAKLAAPAAEGATAAEIASAAHTAGQGGSPSDYLLNAATAIPTGALIGGGTSALPLGRATPAEATSATAQAAQAAELAKGGIKIPSKALGFKVEGQTDPSVSDVEGYRDWLQSQSGDEPPVANNLPTASQRMMTSIDKALASPEVAPVVAQAQKAQSQADWANRLERWGSNAGLPGQAGDVRGQAAEAAQAFPPGAPENTALQSIAKVTDPKERVVPPWVRRSLVGGLGTAGEFGGYFGGLPGGGALGSNIGSEMANLADWYFTPKGPGAAPLIQQQIARSYPALTGRPAPGPGGNQALMNAFLRLYGGGSYGGQPRGP